MKTYSAESTNVNSVVPYRPSWINHLLNRINSSSISPYVLYGVIWLILLTIAHVAAWVNGIISVGSVDPRILIVSLWTPYCLGFIDFLNHTATNALNDFRPALDLTDDEFDQLRYEFTVLPAGPVISVNLIGIALVFISLLVSPETASPFVGTTALAIINVTIASLGIMFSMTAIYQTFRLLRLTRRTYGCARRLKLLQTSQLYAFSSLTLRIGIGWLLIIYSGVIAFPMLLQNPLWTTTSTILILGSASSFVITLANIHHRISSDKTQHLAEVHDLMDEVFHTINQRIRDQQIEDIARLKEAAATLDLERNVLSKLPTWPWQPGTMASFITALMLPLLVWLAQTLLSKFIER